jgi:hypothetical protein
MPQNHTGLPSRRPDGETESKTQPHFRLRRKLLFRSMLIRSTAEIGCPISPICLTDLSHRSVSPICRKNSHPVSFEQKHRFDRNRSTYGLLQPLDASKEEAGGKRNADRGSTKPQETWSQGNRAIKVTRFYSRCLPPLSRTCVPDLPGVMISGRPSPLRSATRIWSPVPTWPSSIVKR